MKLPSRVLAFTASSLLAAAALGQETSSPPPPPGPAPAPAAPTQPVAEQGPTPASGSLTDVRTVRIGPSLTVNSGMPPAEDYGPKPPFEQLANGKKCISHEAAKAYLPLYNDWLHAAGHGNCLSKSQYDRWQ